MSEQPSAETAPADRPSEEPAPHESSRDRLRRLVEGHQAGVWRYLRYLGAEANEADDLVQDTFLSVARTGFAGIGAGGSGFEQRNEHQTAAYLRTAARNQLLMLRRREERQIDTVALEAAEGVWASARADTGWDELLALLADCVGQLENRPRQVINLQYRDRASRAEIAEQMAMKPEGVKTLLRRTRQLLRGCIERKQKDQVNDLPENASECPRSEANE
ncbi:MAG: sigma-70 family RNA polymerase sigma factor [Planctomycetota bacterium]